VTLLRPDTFFRGKPKPANTFAAPRGGHSPGAATRQRRAGFAVAAAEVSLRWPRRLPLAAGYRRELVALSILVLQCQRRRPSTLRWCTSPTTGSGLKEALPPSLPPTIYANETREAYKPMAPVQRSPGARKQWETVAARHFWRRSRTAPGQSDTKPQLLRHQSRAGERITAGTHAFLSAWEGDYVRTGFF